MAERELIPTRIAYLELLDERRLVQEGFELLDEKRTLLAARILAALEELRRARLTLEAAWQAQRARLKDALAVHGLHDLELWPPAATGLEIAARRERVFGLELVAATATIRAGDRAWGEAEPSPAVDASIAATRAFLAAAAATAALETTLARLAEEFIRTERRARAVDHVLLPEIESDLRDVAAALEALEQEEVVRVHRLHAPGY